jgi:hypothetical protein
MISTPSGGDIKSEIISLLADFVGAFVKSIYIV